MSSATKSQCVFARAPPIPAWDRICQDHRVLSVECPMKSLRVVIALGCIAVCTPSLAQNGAFTMEQVLAYPYATGLVAAHGGDHIAWVRNVAGVRNVWVADGPAFKPRQVTQYKNDDGQEITQLTFSPDG